MTINVLKSNHSLAFAGKSIGATEIGTYNQDVPLDVAKAALQNNGLDEIIFEAEGKTYLAYADGLDFSGLKGAPASIFKGNLPVTLRGNYDGKEKDIKILHIDNEGNTALEGAKKLFPLTAISQAIPTAIQVGLMPAAGRAAAQGTNLLAKISRFTGEIVTNVGTKLGIGPVGVAVGVGVLILAAGTAGGAIYYGAYKGEDYRSVRGLIKD